MAGNEKKDRGESISHESTKNRTKIGEIREEMEDEVESNNWLRIHRRRGQKWRREGGWEGKPVSAREGGWEGKWCMRWYRERE